LRGCKSHADRLGIPRGVTGETIKGVVIDDDNRVSFFFPETDITGIKALQSERHQHFRRRGIPATVFGLEQPDGTAKYALYAMECGVGVTA
jgi:hypothetical protein